jgi:catechol 2,3-dioxygenase-like lactoylglutathione lyase family enzyme
MFKINSLVPELAVTDFDRSLKFYTEFLLFEIAQRRRTDPHAYLAFQGSQIMISPAEHNWEERDSWETAALERPFGRGINFQFFVSGVEELYNRVSTAQWPIFLKLHTKWYWRSDRMDRRTQFGIMDPDGYFLRFSEVFDYRDVTEADHTKLNRDYGISA